MVLLCIIGNAIILALDRYPIEDAEDANLEFANMAFFAFFGFELIVKLTAYGFKFYFRDRFNWFDSFVVIVSCLDVALTYGNISKFNAIYFL